MKLDIENKILIPFIILIIVSIFAVGLVSYKGSYSLLLESNVKELQDDLAEIAAVIEQNDLDLSNDQIAGEIKKIKNNNLIVVNRTGEVIYNEG